MVDGLFAEGDLHVAGGIAEGHEDEAADVAVEDDAAGDADDGALVGGGVEFESGVGVGVEACVGLGEWEEVIDAGAERFDAQFIAEAIELVPTISQGVAACGGVVWSEGHSGPIVAARAWETSRAIGLCVAGAGGVGYDRRMVRLDQVGIGSWPGLGRIAAVWAGALALALATQQQSSADLGYHLAYGHVFLDTGRIVDDASFVQPVPTADHSDPKLMPPGSWFDESGRYRFVNENWLSQVLFALVDRVAGPIGLSLLPLLFIGLILGAQAAMLREHGAPRTIVALAWLLCALVSYERFNLRPELLSFAALSVQLWLLSGRLSHQRIIAVVLVQCFFANVHSYWPLGIALCGCLLGGVALRWALFKSDRDALGVIRQLAVALVGMGAVSFIHPAGWRHAIMPWQTLVYLDRYEITNRSSLTISELLESAHPWATIGEFRSLWPGIGEAAAPTLFVLLVGLVALGSIALGVRRNWGLVLAGGLFIAVALGMRRNIAPAAMVLAPVGMLGLWQIAQASPWRSSRRVLGLFRMGLVGLVSIIGLVGIVQVVSQRWYVRENLPWRFGLGLDRTRLFLDCGAWLDEHLEQARPAFTSFAGSSNVLYCSEKIAAVPMLTNTWAQPPLRMYEVHAMGLVPDHALAQMERWGFELAVLPYERATTRGLIIQLSRSESWQPVWVGPRAVVFAHNDLLADEPGLKAVVESDFDYADLREQAVAADRAGGTALRSLAGILEAMGWYELAVAGWEDMLRFEPESMDTHTHLSYCLTQLAMRYRKAGLNDWQSLSDRASQIHEAGQRLKPAR